ncbi:MAG: helix-turn-helix transcriptional regulator [Verrucomicrobia bacterium]|nr:helix-turn-helix transcriptional regulator [Verrucomicrobiota bacterium]
MDTLVKKIGRMVRFHRKKARLTQLELANHSDIGKTAVFDIEKGKKTVRLATLLAVFNTLNIQMKFEGPIMHRFEEHEKS